MRFFTCALLFVPLFLAAGCTSGAHGGCPTGTTSCTPTGGGAAVCRTTSSDVANCGSCNHACTAGQGCFGGTCGALHDMGTGSDLGPAHDSGPGFDSGPAGMCMPTCSASQRCCGVQCVGRVWAGGPNTDGTADTSFFNCGACARSCDPNTANQCGMGTAGQACECGTGPACTGSQICTNTGTGYACQTDCGGGGHGPCAAGSLCCGTGTAATCVMTQTDDANCGSCGHACTTTQTCQAGHCVDLCGGVACRAAAGTDLGEMCCGDACIAVDNDNCGACGMMCDPSSDSCIVGMSFTGTSMVCCAPMGFPFCVPGDGGFPFP